MSSLHLSGLHRRGWWAAALLAMASVTGACRSEAERAADVADGDDPLAALTVLATSRRYTTAYWITQADSNPTLWARATAYCEQQRGASDGARPSCAAVYDAQFELAGRRPPAPRAPAQTVDSLMFRP